MVKFLVDECLGLRVVQWLQSNNYDATSILHGMSGSDDYDVLQKALRENRVLITSDKDFGDLVFQQKLVHPGIVLLRLQSRTFENKIKALEHLFSNHFDELPCNFVVVSDVSVKILKPVMH